MVEKSKNEPATEFELKRVEIQKQGDAGLEAQFEISAAVTEINIFEHIDKPYLTGSIVFADIDRIVELSQINGNETVILTIATRDEIQHTITKTFIVSEIIRISKGNDHSQLVGLSLIEDSGFLSRLMRVSKAYSGTGSSIITQLLNESLGKTIKNISVNEMGASSSMKVLIPNMTPFDAADWIKDRMSTTNGLPFFLFSTICDNMLRLSDLESMLNQTPLNSRTMSYTYGQGFDNRFETFPNKYYNIRNYSVGMTDNQLLLSRKGMIGATYSAIDTTKGKNISGNLNADDMFKSLKYPPDQSMPVYDGRNIKMHEYDTISISQVIPTKIYDDGDMNYHEGDGIDSYLNKAKQRSFRHFLHKTPIEISVPGFNFLYQGVNKSIGNLIEVTIPAAVDMSKREGSVIPSDKKRSGTYLIYGVRHVFQQNIYNAVLSCNRLSYMNRAAGDY